MMMMLIVIMIYDFVKGWGQLDPPGCLQLPRQPVLQLIYYYDNDFNDDDADCDEDDIHDCVKGWGQLDPPGCLHLPGQPVQ